VERPGRFAGDIGDVHRHIASEINVPYRYAVCDQGLFEGETATDQKTHKIILPYFFHVISIFGLVATKDFVSWAVCSQVTPWGQLYRFDLSRANSFKQWARFGVFLTESLEVAGVDLRQNNQIQLCKTSTTARGRLPPVPLAN
jgi:hypothetical protein